MDSERGSFIISSPGRRGQFPVIAMSPSISQEPLSLNPSEWIDLLSQLPLFPPAAQPPPALFPFLSPLLQQKLGFLSLGRQRGWAGALTWLSPDLSYKVNERLKSSGRPDGLQERFRGYRRFDEELILANVALEKAELDFWFSWLPPQDGQAHTGWKLHDIRLPELDTDLHWSESISEATMRFNGAKRNLPPAETGSQDAESDEDEAYWSQYDHYASQIPEENSRTPKEIILKEEEPSAYYERYNNIETAIGDLNLAQNNRTVGNQPTEHLGPLWENRNELDIGLDEYIRNTLRNLAQLASRCGMSKFRFAELINEGNEPNLQNKIK